MPLEKIYIGIQASETLENLKEEPNVEAEVQLFLKTCLNFYIELVTEIKKRFIFDDTLFEYINIIEPKIAYSNIQLFNKIFKRFPILNQFINKQELENEQKKHILLDLNELGIDLNLKANIYWSKIFERNITFNLN